MAMYNGGCYSSFPRPPGGYPELLSPQSAQRKLKKEEMDKSTRRLAEHHHKRVELGPLTPRKVLDPADQEKTNERLYTQELEKRKRAQKEKEDKLVQRLPGKLLDPDQMELSVDRLFNVGQARQKEISARLRAKYGDTSPRKVVSSKEELNALNDRFYSSRSKGREERDKVLLEKYVYSREPPPKKLTKQQMQTTTERLAIVSK
eukprot:TRINITY_DN13596_c0_g1_i1.p1 TRINITY_DN13596_c0_g1~~TRINITY_DN13596_c0_g1_i1.p1  ORF type:complete len:204 (+),score=65.37 TRINITY_DN13596_c0_g1_i1:86-697(+)